MIMTQEELAQYHRDGYVLVNNLFDREEIDLMIREIEGGERVAGSTYSNDDRSGLKAKLAIWFELGPDMWSAVSTCPRLVNNVSSLLGEDAAFFHGKVMLKEARSGGAWEWHQDYGYWYDQGFIYPNMISVFIALDAATKENGCLQVLRGSHLLGRLEHGKVGGQTGADVNRIRHLQSMFELVHCEMAPGSALFFHSNLLHSSAPNLSDYHRRTFVSCYNATGNPQLQSQGLKHYDRCPVGSDDWLTKF
ncbi:phytanoyl-CoA dioxygenase family protein [Paenibacillus lignilyticus]|uniref:Phytanoyl-CoA dioxygenase family protein n=1 Tax=Paenibacillus lignilyticus TaxID=1172615 RepID=A0ABS5CDA3_9BACL|nr:phytanoyl-CoA dioxygenase family protein [Paenibacillus lignilyticus]MBP3963962.1 phytanoyl-CoA dioxygenase family protein [Paenibacillus lignilyticus]